MADKLNVPYAVLGDAPPSKYAAIRAVLTTTKAKIITVIVASTIIITTVLVILDSEHLFPFGPITGKKHGHHHHQHGSIIPCDNITWIGAIKCEADFATFCITTNTNNSCANMLYLDKCDDSSFDRFCWQSTTPQPTSQPTTTIPTTSAPTTLIPTTSSPTISPTSSIPTTVQPTTVSPTTDPTIRTPTTAYPTTTLSPTTNKPTSTSPSTSLPTLFPTTYVPTSSNPTTFNPTLYPTTSLPTISPTSSISVSPTTNPTRTPTKTPTTLTPTTSYPTTTVPTTLHPASLNPTTFNPTLYLTTSSPTISPTHTMPTTVQPTSVSPTIQNPTKSPTITLIPSQSNPTRQHPTISPSATFIPTTKPSVNPTDKPTYKWPTPSPTPKSDDKCKQLGQKKGLNCCCMSSCAGRHCDRSCGRGFSNKYLCSKTQVCCCGCGCNCNKQLQQNVIVDNTLPVSIDNCSWNVKYIDQSPQFRLYNLCDNQRYIDIKIEDFTEYDGRTHEKLKQITFDDFSSDVWNWYDMSGGIYTQHDGVYSIMNNYQTLNSQFVIQTIFFREAGNVLHKNSNGLIELKNVLEDSLKFNFLINQWLYKQTHNYLVLCVGINTNNPRDVKRKYKIENDKHAIWEEEMESNNKVLSVNVAENKEKKHNHLDLCYNFSSSNSQFGNMTYDPIISYNALNANRANIYCSFYASLISILFVLYVLFYR